MENIIVSIIDQYASPSTLIDANGVQSGLAHARLGQAPDTTADLVADLQASSLTLIEQAVDGLLLLRANTGAAALSAALQSRCGLARSERLKSTEHARYCVRWMSPDCWLLSCPLEEAFEIETALRDAVNEPIAIVNVSGGYSVLHLCGADAQHVLMKSTGYDTHPEHFVEGKVVNTTFAKAQVTLRAISVDEDNARYEIVVRRSFADYMLTWLQRAGQEYGLKCLATGV